MKIILTSKDACELFGISRAGLSDWARQGAPKLERGSWDLKALFDWREKNIVGKIETREAMAREKLKRETARAGISTLELQKRQGEVIEVDRVVSDLSTLCANMKTSLRAWAKRLPPVLFGRTQKEIGREILREADLILTDFSEGVGLLCEKASKKKARGRGKARDGKTGER